MAQYGHSIYGTSYYGVTNAFTGEYLTDELSTSEVLTGTVGIALYTVLLSAATNITYDLSWIDNSTSTYGSVATTKISGRMIILSYIDNVGNDTAAVTIKKWVNGSPTTTTVDVNMAVAGPTLLVGDEFGEYEIEITKKNNDTNPINVTSIQGIVTDVAIETRARLDNGVWLDWASLDRTYNNTADNEWTVSATTPDYSSYNKIQIKLTLASTDSLFSPEILKCNIIAGDTANRTSRGTWVAAVAFGPSFKEYTTISWASTEPDGTEIHIQTQSSNNNIDWDILSAPYVQGDSSQIRVIKGYTGGTITSNVISPENLTKWLTYQTTDWSGTAGNNVWGPTARNTYVEYEILKDDGTGNWVNFYGDYKYSRAPIEETIVRYEKQITVPVKIKATLYKMAGFPTPYISKFNTKCLSTYDETKVLSGTVSLVDNNNDGDIQLTTIPDLAFTIPTGCNNPRYTIINVTNKAYIHAYWNSQAQLSARQNFTDEQTDVLRIRCIETQDSGNRRFYQYRASTVIHPVTEKTPLLSYFICPNDSTIKFNISKTYRYFLEMGWDNPPVGVDSGSNRNSDGRIIDIWWESLGIGDDPPAEDPLTWNMVTSSNLDMIYAKVYSPGVAEEVPWESDQITGSILDGSMPIVNPNGVKANYIKRNIKLPVIDVDVICESQPFVTEVIPGSVKCNGFTVDDSRVQLVSIDVEFSDEVYEFKHPIVRGEDTTKDLFGHHSVLEIIGVYNTTDTTLVDYLPDVDYLFDSLTNSIDWSPNGVAPPAREPVGGATYYVTYRYRAATNAIVTFKCDFTESISQRDLWTSKEVFTRTGVATPDKDFVDENLPVMNINNFPSAYHNGVLKFDPSTLKYTIDDNNLWVKTYIDGNKAVGTLRQVRPKNHWLPQVHSGFYYLNKDRYYFYSESVTKVLDDEFMPLATNITYETGKFDKGAKFSNVDSVVTYPRDINFSNPGALAMWIKPAVTMDVSLVSEPVLFEMFDDNTHYMIIKYAGGKLLLTIVNGVDSYTAQGDAIFNAGSLNHIAVNWNNTCNIYVNGSLLCSANIVLPEFVCKSFSVGNSRNSLGNVCNCVIDELVLFNRELDEDDILSIYNAVSPLSFDRSIMLMKCGFEDNINETFNGSFVAINPAPAQRAPLIIQKSNGTPLRKVSFSDQNTGDFITYNTEEFISDGGKEIVVSFNNLELDKFKTIVYNNSASIGNPLTISGNKITMSLTNEEADRLNGKKLQVVYQPKDCYVWDSNGKNGAAFIRIAHNLGEPLTITYEKNNLVYALAHTAELNPLLNPNHDGFMFVSNEPSLLQYYRINISPDHLLCNGIDIATIVIETVDKFGNPTNNVNLDVSSLYGNLTRYETYGVNRTVGYKDPLSYDKYTLSAVAGRHVVIYRAPYKTIAELPDAIYDTIRITDSVSGLGVEVKIKLLAIDDYGLGG